MRDATTRQRLRELADRLRKHAADFGLAHKQSEFACILAVMCGIANQLDALSEASDTVAAAPQPTCSHCGQPARRGEGAYTICTACWMARVWSPAGGPHRHIGGHTCIADDGGSPGRTCYACLAESVQATAPEPPEPPPPYCPQCVECGWSEIECSQAWIESGAPCCSECSHQRRAKPVESKGHAHEPAESPASCEPTERPR